VNKLPLKPRRLLAAKLDLIESAIIDLVVSNGIPLVYRDYKLGEYSFMKILKAWRTCILMVVVMQ